MTIVAFLPKMSSTNVDDDNVVEPIVFKKKRCAGNRRAVRTFEEVEDDVATDSKSKGGDDQGEEVDWKTLNELRELQKVKRRNNQGINLKDLLGENKKKTETISDGKPSGGLTSRKALVNDLDLGNTFSQETNRRDEDAELMKYVEEELAKRRQAEQKDNQDTTSSVTPTKTTIDELLLKVIPENLLKVSEESKQKSEEMLSSQMLSGIPEVDLGVEERIRTIEKTETAKAKLLEEKWKQGKERHSNRDNTSFAPANLSSCYKNNPVHLANSGHRFNLHMNNNQDVMAIFNKDNVNTSSSNKQQQQQQQLPQLNFDIEPVVVIGDEPQKIRLPKPMDKERRQPGKDKPQDDYIFQKFRKHVTKH